MTWLMLVFLDREGQSPEAIVEEIADKYEMGQLCWLARCPFREI